LQSLPAGGAQDGGAEGGGGSPDGGDEGQYRAGRSNTRFQFPGDDTPEIGRRSKTSSVAPVVAGSAADTTTTVAPDWDEVCKVLCKTGDGGSLCNCDLSPFFS